MKKIILLLIFISSTSWARGLDTVWIANYSGPDSLQSEPTKLLIDQFNNVIIAGITETNSGRWDIAILKYDNYGTLLWCDVYDGPAHKTDKPTHLAVDNYGYIYVAGESRGVHGFIECNGVVILKYHPTGELAWVKRYDEEIGSIVYVQGLTVDSKRNIICTTKLIEGQTLTMNKLLTRKFYPTGELAWEEHLPVQNWSYGLGVNSDDYENIFLGGRLGQGNDNSDYVFFALLKYDANGALQWFSSFQDSLAWNTYCEVITNDKDGNIIAAGETEKITRDEYCTTVKYDGDGNLIWYKELPAGNDPEVYDITTDSEGNIIWIAEDRNDSTYEYETIITKYLANGDSAWIQYLQMDSDEPLLVRTDEGGNVYTLSRVWEGSYSPTVFKLDPLGKILWTWSYDEEEFRPVDFAIDKDKNIIVTGNLEIEGTDRIVTLKMDQSAITSLNTNPQDIIVPTFTLSQNYPNPVNPSTIISWQLPKAGFVTLKIYDVLGREVESLINEYKEAGHHSTFYIINSELASGVYFYQLKTDGYIETKKMILLK
jgi:hypothetical protein